MTETGSNWRAFWGLFVRDLAVLRRQVVAFIIRTVMNPLMFVFVFTYLFPKMGQGFQSSSGASFGTLILPGLLAVGIFIQGIMATALPLSMEIGATREIHDACATLKLGRCPTRLPVVLESAAELAASESDNGIGSADRPEHTGLFEPAQNRFAACLDDSRAHK